LTFGLGKAGNVDRITIQWPGKDVGQQEHANLAINKSHQIRQGDFRVTNIGQK